MAKTNVTYPCRGVAAGGERCYRLPCCWMSVWRRHLAAVDASDFADRATAASTRLPGHCRRRAPCDPVTIQGKLGVGGVAAPGAADGGHTHRRQLAGIR